MSELKLDVDQAGELKAAFRREKGSGGSEYTNEKIKMLCERRGLLGQVLDILDGYAEITPIAHVVNGDADPFAPIGWSVEIHIKSGPMKLERRGAHLYLNGKKIVLFVSEKQRGGKSVRGYELREELSGKKVLNANVLDYLLAHPELIPESWKEQTNGNTTCIFFWGTIYRSSDVYLGVRCLDWVDGEWHWYCSWLNDVFYDNYPVALRAS